MLHNVQILVMFKMRSWYISANKLLFQNLVFHIRFKGILKTTKNLCIVNAIARVFLAMPFLPQYLEPPNSTRFKKLKLWQVWRWTPNAHSVIYRSMYGTEIKKMEILRFYVQYESSLLWKNQGETPHLYSRCPHRLPSRWPPKPPCLLNIYLKCPLRCRHTIYISVT